MIDIVSTATADDEAKIYPPISVVLAPTTEENARRNWAELIFQTGAGGSKDAILTRLPKKIVTLFLS